MATENKKDPFALESGVPALPPIGDSLRPTPKFADRISKRVLAVAFSVVAVVVVIFLLSLDQMDNKKAAKPQAAPSDKPSSTKTEIKLDPELGGEVGPAEGNQPVPATLPKPAASSDGGFNPFGGKTVVPPQEKQGGAIVPAIGSEIPSDQSAIPPSTVPALTPEQQAEKA